MEVLAETFADAFMHFRNFDFLTTHKRIIVMYITTVINNNNSNNISGQRISTIGRIAVFSPLAAAKGLVRP